MAYNKTNWQDTLRDAQGNVIQKGTPLNAQALGKIEEGIVQTEQKIDTEIGKVTTQLAQKASKEEVTTINTVKADRTYVDSNISNLDIKISRQASGSPKGTYATLTELTSAFPAGNQNIYVVTADGKWYYWNNSAWVPGGTYQSTGIASGTVTPELTTFIAKSKNLFNKDMVLNNYWLNASGVEEVKEGWVTSDFIPVSPSTAYVRNLPCIVVRYNSDKTFNGFLPNNNTNFSTNIATHFIKISTLIGNTPGLQIEKGTVPTNYESYSAKIKDFKVDFDILDKDIQQEIRRSSKNTEEVTNPYTPYPKTITHLINEENNLTVSNGVAYLNFTEKWKGFNSGRKIIVSSAATSSIVANYSVPKGISGVSAIGIWIYLKDRSKINTITLELNTDNLSYTWVRGASSEQLASLKTGWNLLRFGAFESNITNWENLYAIKLSVGTNASTEWTFGTIFTERSPKAQILFVEDGGYTEFYERGLPDLKARNIPITWALNPGYLGEGRRITKDQVDILAEDFNNSFSFHSWRSGVTADMNAEQLRTDAIRCKRWIQKEGLQPRYWWRAAFTQNLAPQHESIQELFEAYASPNGKAGFNVFPFIDRWNVARLGIHGRSNQWFDDHFSILKKTNSLLIVYTHGVGLDSVSGLQNTTDMSMAEWSYFLQKLDEGISGGWLEGVTYDQLRFRHEQQFGGYGYDNLIDATRKLEL